MKQSRINPSSMKPASINPSRMKPICHTSARLIVFAALCVTSCASTQKSANTSGSSANDYRILNTYKIRGEGRWDYLAVDVDTRRLFVTHEMSVMVLDVDTGQPVGRIANTPGVHGVAFANDLNRGFTSNGRANTATIFDLTTLKVLGSVATGDKPDAIVYEPTTKRVFAMNGESGDSTVIDAASGRVIGSIALGGQPEFAVVDGSGKLFVNLEDTNEIVVLDPQNLTIMARWSLSPGEEPSGLAIDVKNRRLFSVCGNGMMVITDADTGKVLATPKIGEDSDGAAFDPARNLAFSSNGEGTLTIVHEDSPSQFSVVQTVKTMRGARTMTLDPKTHNVFLSSAEYGQAQASENESSHTRQDIVPNSFRVIVVGN